MSDMHWTTYSIIIYLVICTMVFIVGLINGYMEGKDVSYIIWFYFVTPVECCIYFVADLINNIYGRKR